MDVTEAILSTTQQLKFERGATIEQAIEQRVTAFPVSLKYRGNVGLFGAENTFIKYNLDIKDTLSHLKETEGPDGYFGLTMGRGVQDEDPDYYSITEDSTVVEALDGGYVSAEYATGIKSPETTRISVEINNLKTGNRFTDVWFNVSLYNRDKKPHGHDLMYLAPDDFFYVGFHSRVPKSLPYNVEVQIGNEYLSTFNMTEEQKAYEG